MTGTTETVWLSSGWPVWPGKTGPKQPTLMVALLLTPFTWPRKVWLGPIGAGSTTPPAWAAPGVASRSAAARTGMDHRRERTDMDTSGRGTTTDGHPER